MILKKSGLSELQNGTPDGIQTITGLRISAVDGTAFLDNCAELQKYAGRMIRIYDSGSRYLEGWIKANGSGEGLSEIELLSGKSWTNYVANPFETFTVSGLDITSAINSSSGACCWLQITASIGVLAKLTTNIIINASDIAAVVFDNTNNLSSSTRFEIIQNIASSNNYSVYGTMPYVNPYFGYRVTNSHMVNFSASGHSIKQVLTPSALGLTIVSTQGGSTYNFTTKTASFVYNAASYRYKIF